MSEFVRLWSDIKNETDGSRGGHVPHSSRRQWAEVVKILQFRLEYLSYLAQPWTVEQLQGPHHQRHISCLSGVWSGTTLRRTSVQLSKPSDATCSVRPVGQPGCGHKLPQPGQLTIEMTCWAITTTTALIPTGCSVLENADWVYSFIFVFYLGSIYLFFVFSIILSCQ